MPSLVAMDTMEDNELMCVRLGRGRRMKTAPRLPLKAMMMRMQAVEVWWLVWPEECLF